jgi:8-oxo-dGTP pyrophosphatase MutT (NUDIX family)
MSNNDKNPWTLLGSREIYRNPWIRVREDQVLRPDKKQGIYGVIEFQSLAIGIVPVTDDMETVLTGQYRYPVDEYSWELPEGGGSLGKDPLDEAKRELLEETGITANEWIDLGPFHLSNSVTNEAGRISLARRLSFGKPNPDGDEVIETKKISLGEAFDMCMDGRITDAVSIIGIARALNYMGGE